MRKISVCIKVLSVALMVGAVTVAWGRELLISSFGRHLPRGAVIFDFDVKTENSAIAKLENKVLDRCTKTAERRENKELPFLTNCIKYKCVRSGKYVCFYNSNQRMLYDALAEKCIYFCYDCKIGNCALFEKECEEIARDSVSEAFGNSKKQEIVSVETIFKNEKVIAFNIRTGGEDEAFVRVSVRRDTGSIVLFDALGAADEDTGGEYPS